MKNINFTHILSMEENNKVNRKYNKCKSLLDRGLITKKEAVYGFQKWAMENFNSHKSFEICTNVDF